MINGKNLIGKTFNRLRVIDAAESYRYPSGQLHKQWLCECDCGARTIVRQHALIQGHTTSCGCYLTERRKTHGMSKTAAYSSWRSMISRCQNQRDISWPNYGGRGIKVCDRWQLFDNFVSDMGNPSRGMSIDRINNDGHYEPQNCRWAARKTQCRNKRTNTLLTLNGVCRTLADWSEATAIPAPTISRRIRTGWSVSDALTLPVGVWTKKRADAASRNAKSGEEAHNAKLTFQKASEIRKAKAKNPNLSARQIGAQFGVGRETARKVIKGMAWT